MPSTTTPLVLSGSTSGRPIKITATAIASGTTIHTVSALTGGLDDVFLSFTNTDTVPRTLTLGWGGVTDPDDLICKALTVPPGGPYNLIGGIRLGGGLIIKAAASTANVILVSGGANRSE